ncbi:hypothetical protein Tco_1116352 [Tanacetum coccineum]
MAFPKVGEINALLNPVTSNSVPSSRESIVVNNERVIPSSRVDNFVTNKHVKARVRTKPITVSQPHVITKNDVNSKTNGFLLKTLKALLGPEDHSLGTILRVISANQKKHKPRVWKPKKAGSKERLASPSKPRSCLRWSPTRRMFDLKGKIIATSESVCQSDCPKGDNACTSNPQELINKWFPCSTFSMTGCQNWLDTLLIPLLSEYKLKDKENHRDNECDS